MPRAANAHLRDFWYFKGVVACSSSAGTAKRHPKQRLPERWRSDKNYRFVNGTIVEVTVTGLLLALIVMESRTETDSPSVSDWAVMPAGIPSAGRFVPECCAVGVAGRIDGKDSCTTSPFRLPSGVKTTTCVKASFISLFSERSTRKRPKRLPHKYNGCGGCHPIIFRRKKRSPLPASGAGDATSSRVTVPRSLRVPSSLCRTDGCGTIRLFHLFLSYSVYSLILFANIHLARCNCEVDECSLI